MAMGWLGVSAAVRLSKGPTPLENGVWIQGVISERVALGAKDYHRRIIHLEEDEVSILLPKYLAKRRDEEFSIGEVVAVLTSAQETFGPIWDQSRHLVPMTIEAASGQIYSYQDFTREWKSVYRGQVTIVVLFALLLVVIYSVTKRAKARRKFP